MKRRFDKVRIANLYDSLDKLNYPNQCLDVRIKPLFPNQRLAGVAVTFEGAKGKEIIPLKEGEKPTGKEFFEKVAPYLEEDCIIVIDAAGEKFSGKMGEMTSWFFKRGGANGIVVDGYIRDYHGLEVIPDYSVCCRGTSPVESAKRWRVSNINTPIALAGTLMRDVEVLPGDWIVGGADGVLVIPAAIAEEALLLAEEIESKEEGMRKDLLAGMDFDDCFKKWGRA